MARTRKLTPTYSHHKQSGRGRLTWTDPLGIRNEKLLPGPFGSPESLTAKARLELELASSPTGALATNYPISVAEVFLAFQEHAKRHYRRGDGTNTTDRTRDAYDQLLSEMARVLRPGGRFVFSVNVPDPSWSRIARLSLGAALRTERPLRYLKRAATTAMRIREATFTPRGMPLAIDLLRGQGTKIVALAPVGGNPPHYRGIPAHRGDSEPGTV